MATTHRDELRRIGTLPEQLAVAEGFAATLADRMEEDRLRRAPGSAGPG